MRVTLSTGYSVDIHVAAASVQCRRVSEQYISHLPTLPKDIHSLTLCPVGNQCSLSISCCITQVYIVCSHSAAGEAETPVDMETINLDPEAEVMLVAFLSDLFKEGRADKG